MNNLSLLTGSDISFAEGRITIHQPTIAEISMIGEDNFFKGCAILNFSKSMLNDKDKLSLEKIDIFHIFMSIMTEQNVDESIKDGVNCAKQVLNLLFPNIQISYQRDKLAIGEDGFLNSDNFINFQAVLRGIFKLSSIETEDNYKPANKAANRLADKFAKAKAKIAQQKGEDSVNIYGRFMSIISIYCGISLVELSKYTVCQLYDAFSRVQLKAQYDIFVQAKMAGAQDLKSPEEWTKDLYQK